MQECLLQTCSKKEYSKEQLNFLSPVFNAVISPEVNFERVKKLYVLDSLKLSPEQALSNRTVYSLTQPRKTETIAPEGLNSISYAKLVKVLQEKFEPITNLMIDNNLKVASEEFENKMNELMRGMPKRFKKDFKNYTKKVVKYLNSKKAAQEFNKELKALEAELNNHLTYLLAVKKAVIQKIKQKSNSIKECRKEDLINNCVINASFELYENNYYNLENIVKKSIKDELKAKKKSKKVKAIGAILLGLLSGAELLRTYNSVQTFQKSYLKLQEDSDEGDGSGGATGGGTEGGTEGEEDKTEDEFGGISDDNNNGVNDSAENYYDYDEDGIPDSIEKMIIDKYEIEDVDGDGEITVFDVEPQKDYDNNGQTLLQEFVDPGGEIEDFDFDGIPDLVEKYTGTNEDDFKEGREDVDDDGLPTEFEWRTEYNPAKKATYDNISDGEQDPDNDGLKNIDEFEIFQTDIFNPDTDGNGITDGEEDFDGDEYTNAEEIIALTDPLNQESYPGREEHELKEKITGISLLGGTGLLSLGIGYYLGRRNNKTKQNKIKVDKKKKKKIKKELKENGPKIGGYPEEIKKDKIFQKYFD